MTATQDSIVWVIDRFTFRRIVTDLTAKKLSAYTSFLKNVDLLRPLAEYEREKIAEALEEINILQGNGAAIATMNRLESEEENRQKARVT